MTSSTRNEIKILLVDDEPLILDSISQLLGMRYTVYTAQNPEAAYGILVSQDIDLVMVDQNLHASATGVELAINLRSQYHELRIIMLTGETDSKVVLDALNSGAIDSFLSKPFDIDKVHEYIEKNIKTIKTKERQLSKIVENIRLGKKLSKDEISQVAEDLGQLESLLFDYRITSSANITNDIEVLGLVIFNKDEVLYKHLITEEFTIQDERMFRGLISTLSVLPNELFSLAEEAKILDEIKLPNIHMKVDSVEQDHTIVLFLGGSGDIPHTIDRVVRDFFELYQDMVGSVHHLKYEDKLTKDLYVLRDKIRTIQSS